MCSRPPLLSLDKFIHNARQKAAAIAKFPISSSRTLSNSAVAAHDHHAQAASSLNRCQAEASSCSSDDTYDRSRFVSNNFEAAAFPASSTRVQAGQDSMQHVSSLSGAPREVDDYSRHTQARQRSSASDTEPHGNRSNSRIKHGQQRSTEVNRTAFSRMILRHLPKSDTSSLRARSERSNSQGTRADPHHYHRSQLLENSKQLKGSLPAQSQQHKSLPAVSPPAVSMPAASLLQPSDSAWRHVAGLDTRSPSATPEHRDNHMHAPFKGLEQLHCTSRCTRYERCTTNSSLPNLGLQSAPLEEAGSPDATDEENRKSNEIDLLPLPIDPNAHHVAQQRCSPRPSHCVPKQHQPSHAQFPTQSRFGTNSDHLVPPAKGEIVTMSTSSKPALVRSRKHGPQVSSTSDVQPLGSAAKNAGFSARMRQHRVVAKAGNNVPSSGGTRARETRSNGRMVYRSAVSVNRLKIKFGRSRYHSSARSGSLSSGGRLSPQKPNHHKAGHEFAPDTELVRAVCGTGAAVPPPATTTGSRDLAMPTQLQALHGKFSHDGVLPPPPASLSSKAYDVPMQAQQPQPQQSQPQQSQRQQQRLQQLQQALYESHSTSSGSYAVAKKPHLPALKPVRNPSAKETPKVSDAATSLLASDQFPKAQQPSYYHLTSSQKAIKQQVCRCCHVYV